MCHRLPLLALALLAGPAAAAEPVASLTVSPASVEIRHHRHPHAVQVLGTTPDGYTVDLRGEAKLTSANPAVATVDERGWIQPVASGHTTITVAAAGQTKTIAVTVKLPAAEPPASYRHEV